MRWILASLILVSCSGLVGCSDGNRFDISVDVRTDLVPGLDFFQVETRQAAEPIAGAREPRTTFLADFAGADFIAGHRVAEITGVPGGQVYIEVRLVGASGETVLSRETVIDLSSDYALTLVLSSRCTGVLCPAADDPVAHTACLGGACVDPRCSVEDPTYCGEPQCTSNADCASSGCRTGVCGDRTCLSEPDDSVCGAGQLCASDGVCVAQPTDSGVPTDAGPMDSGRVDTGVADTAVADTRPTTSGVFCPDQSLLRSEMAVFLVGYIHGVTFSPPAATGVFSDVDVSSFFAPYIEQLARDGITLGCGGGRFCPNDPVLRDQAATFLVRAVYGPMYRPPAAVGVFSDVPSTNFHRDAIEQIYRDGITRGCATGLYCPSDPLLRRHFAVFFVRVVHGRSYEPPPAVGLFGDVPTTDVDAPFIEQLAWDGFTRGC